MERPSFEGVLDMFSNIEEDKKYSVIELHADSENKKIMVKTNPEFVNIIKPYTLNALIAEVGKTLEELQFENEKKENHETIMKIFLEKEKGKYEISIDAHEIFGKKMELFEEIENVVKEIILLTEEKINEYKSSEGHVLETETKKLVFNKKLDLLDSEQTKKEFERLKGKYSFIKNLKIMMQIFEQEACEVIEFVYKTDGFMEWDEVMYTYNKNVEEEKV